MKLPKTFVPDKKLGKKLEELMEGPEEVTNYKQALEVLKKIDIYEGILYCNLTLNELENSNLPDKNISEISLACRIQGEHFFRYRFNYENLKNVCSIKIKTKKNRQLSRNDFKLSVMKVVDYYNMKSYYPKDFFEMRYSSNNCIIKIGAKQDKNDIIQAVKEFFIPNFQRVLFSRVVYKGVHDEDFLYSNLPLKKLSIDWRKLKY